MTGASGADVRNRQVSKPPMSEHVIHVLLSAGSTVINGRLHATG